MRYVGKAANLEAPKLPAIEKERAEGAARLRSKLDEVVGQASTLVEQQKERVRSISDSAMQESVRKHK